MVHDGSTDDVCDSFIRNSKILDCGISIAYRICNISKDLYDHLKAIEKAVLNQQITNF